jgi:hypothetical protein
VVNTDEFADGAEESEGVEVLNIINGDLIVRTGESVAVRGIRNGDLTVEPGGKARVTGIINGTTLIRQGELELIGIANGDVINHGGNITLGPNAQIKGNRIDDAAD